MSSDEVMNQIIRAIVQKSTEILKTDTTSVETSGQTVGDILASRQQNTEDIAKIEPLRDVGEKEGGFRTVNDLFLQDIHSHIKPFQITETLAAFMIRAVVLNPKYDFDVSKEMSRSDVDRLINVFTISY